MSELAQRAVITSEKTETVFCHDHTLLYEWRPRLLLDYPVNKKNLQAVDSFTFLMNANVSLKKGSFYMRVI